MFTTANTMITIASIVTRRRRPSWSPGTNITTPHRRHRINRTRRAIAAVFDHRHHENGTVIRAVVSR